MAPSFKDSLKVDLSAAEQEYEKYTTEFKTAFRNQALSEHSIISTAFPELNFRSMCRIKSRKSFLDKAKTRELDRIFDAHGIKHILLDVDGNNSEELLTEYCYKIRDFLCETYQSLSVPVICSRFKDYIENPKNTGYQALHFSGEVTDGTKRKFEVQIKTKQMEENSKFGTASHSLVYKTRTVKGDPLARLPIYFPITDEKGSDGSSNCGIRQLSTSEAFKYFYGITLEDYLTKLNNPDGIELEVDQSSREDI